MSELKEIPQRRYELDWLRVLVILNLIPYHAAWLMVAVPGFSSIDKESAGGIILTIYFTFFRQWHMPLLFLIAGVSTCYALGFRSICQYIIERIKRLLVPLVFSVVVLSPIGFYFFPGISQTKSIPDYFTRFWPGFIQRFPNPDGPPEWAHLWFLGYLFIMSLVCLPLFIYLRHEKRKRTISHLARLCDRWGMTFMPGFFFTIIYATLRIHWPFTYYHALYNDWAYFCYNLIAFILGYVICLDERFWQAIDRHFKISFVLGGTCAVVVFWMLFKMPAFSTPQYTIRYVLYSILFGFNTWFWVVAMLGFARKYLSHTNLFLKYFNRASYPIYILHLIVMVVLGYLTVRWHLGVTMEFVVFSILSFIAIILTYETLVKRTKVTRFLFGMKI